MFRQGLVEQFMAFVQLLRPNFFAFRRWTEHGFVLLGSAMSSLQVLISLCLLFEIDSVRMMLYVAHVAVV